MRAWGTAAVRKDRKEVEGLTNTLRAINRFWKTTVKDKLGLDLLFWIGPYATLAILTVILCVVFGVLYWIRRNTAFFVLMCVFGLMTLGLAVINLLHWTVGDGVTLSYILLGGAGVVFLGMLALDISTMAMKEKQSRNS